VLEKHYWQQNEELPCSSDASTGSDFCLIRKKFPDHRAPDPRCGRYLPYLGHTISDTRSSDTCRSPKCFKQSAWDNGYCQSHRCVREFCGNHCATTKEHKLTTLAWQCSEHNGLCKYPVGPKKSTSTGLATCVAPKCEGWKYCLDHICPGAHRDGCWKMKEQHQPTCGARSCQCSASGCTAYLKAPDAIFCHQHSTIQLLEYHPNGMPPPDDPDMAAEAATALTELPDRTPASQRHPEHSDEYGNVTCYWEGCKNQFPPENGWSFCQDHTCQAGTCLRPRAWNVSRTHLGSHCVNHMACDKHRCKTICWNETPENKVYCDRHMCCITGCGQETCMFDAVYCEERESSILKPC